MTTLSQDPLALLSDARPTDDHLREVWTDERAAAVLAATVAARHGSTSPAGPARPRLLVPRRAVRRAAFGAVAAAAACAVVLGSNVLAPKDAMPQAHAIERLAQVAATAPATTPGPHEYVHQVVRYVQRGRDAQTPAIDTTSESWVRADGTTWFREVSRRAPVTTTYRRVPPAQLGDDPYFGIRPSDYLSWPTGTTQLRQYLEEHLNRAAVPEQRAVTQAVFEGLSDRLATGTTPPALNAAMIRVLGSLPGVRTSSTTYDGHPAVRLAFTYQVEDALYLDAQTAAFLGQTMPGSASHVLTREVVSAVPAEVRRGAKQE